MTDRILTKMRRLALCAVPLVLVWNIAAMPARAQDAAAPAQAQSQSQSQSQNQRSFSQAQITQLVAPIAAERLNFTDRRISRMEMKPGA